MRVCLDERRGGAFAQGKEVWEGGLPKARKTKPVAATELQRVMETHRHLLRSFGTDLYDNGRDGKA